MFSFTTLQTTLDDGVLAVRIDAPPINLIGPDLVRDLVGLIRALPDEPDIRGRALEAILGAADFDAPLAERYGWINRALPDADLDGFVTTLARRIAAFPPAGVRAAKHVVNDLTLPGEDEFRADAHRFQQLVATPEAQSRIRALLAEGLQTRGPAELELPSHLASLPAAGA